MENFSIRMTGTKHHPEGLEIMEDFGFPSPARVELVRDRGNRFDDSAVRVMYEGTQLGWLDAKNNQRIAELLDADRQALVLLDPDKLTLRIEFL